MSDPFLAEVRIFAGNFAPTGWAICDGQLLPLSQNLELFALLGNTYGGDGKNDFALPNLQGSVVIGAGLGPGLPYYDLGAAGGSQDVSLLQEEIPSHSHTIGCTDVAATTGSPSPTVILANGTAPDAYISSGPAWVQLDWQSLGMAGGSGAHNNMQPYLTLLYIIALQGVFPVRPFDDDDAAVVLSDDDGDGGGDPDGGVSADDDPDN